MLRSFASRSSRGLGLISARQASAGTWQASWGLSRNMATRPQIVYTKTDEAPALATYSLLPIIKAFTAHAGIDVRLSDISLAGRIIANFPENLSPEQRINDELAELGALAKTPEANIIKLPNISASALQLQAAVTELQKKGYNIPNVPTDPQTPEQHAIVARYSKVMGSAVNPVLREGNSDRRAAPAVKAYAKKYPHSMGAWFPSSRTEVKYMKDGDFFSNEKSITFKEAAECRIELVAADGTVKVMKAKLPVLAGEILDATFMSKKKLVAFLDDMHHEAKEKGLLYSLHLKATMMKISDPIIFGHAVRSFFKELYQKHGETLDKLGANPNNGFADILAKIETLPLEQKTAIKDTIQHCYDEGPELAMVDSGAGITNLHVPSDVIIDASMPACIRSSGQMWDSSDTTQDTLAIIPDETYAGIYETVVNFHRMHGAFDPTTMGSVPNVGLMAQKAEEYGSHDKTFEIPSAGTMRVVDTNTGKVIHEHVVEKGDIWRACQTKDAPIQDWVKLAVNRARATGAPAVFWLDEIRAHDREVILKVNKALKGHDLAKLDIRIMAPKVAMRFTLIRAKAGQDTISVTGNVLRDYLTDLFPILELGTSAKMLSIVPLMNGGGMFETGAGGSAPKHVQQFAKEGHLRWDSLGEFLALACSLEHIYERGNNVKAKVLADALNKANTHFLLNNRSPRRKVNQLDNRGSHFYFCLYWAQELAAQTEDLELQAKFKDVVTQINGNRSTIISELSKCQGPPVFLGGYYMPDDKLASSAMRPSPVLNKIVDSLLL